MEFRIKMYINNNYINQGAVSIPMFVYMYKFMGG